MSERRTMTCMMFDREPLVKITFLITQQSGSLPPRCERLWKVLKLLGSKARPVALGDLGLGGTQVITYDGVWEGFQQLGRIKLV